MAILNILTSEMLPLKINIVSRSTSIFISPLWIQSSTPSVSIAIMTPTKGSFII